MRVLNIQAETLPTKGATRSMTLMAVLACGNDLVGDYAVYIGATLLPDHRRDNIAYFTARDIAAEWVAHNGQKLTYKKALVYFPDLDRKTYRD